MSFEIMINGKVTNNVVDGYERVITLLPVGSSHQLIGYCVHYDEYLESNQKSEIIFIGQEYSFNVSIKLVTKYSIHSHTETLEFVQPNIKLPSIAVKARVVEIVSEKEIKVQIPNLGENVPVEFECDVNAKIGEVIVFTGQLEFELPDENW